MNCVTCGAVVQTAATFCHQCGAPVAPGGVSVAVALDEPPVRFTFEASALGLFGRGLLVALSGIFIVPLPWIFPWFYRWFAGEVRGSDGECFQFSGSASNVWKVLMILALLVGLSIALDIAQGDDDSAKWLIGDLLIQFLSLFFAWAITKWIIDHLELRGRRWRFDGSLWGFIGWHLLVSVSILTIIGWAWALVKLYNWVTDNIRDAGGKVIFLGAGHQILWRTFVLFLFCLPIVTIPWAIRWYYAWLISQVELLPEAEA